MFHSPSTAKHILRLQCDPIPMVRIGLIGLGKRGMKALERYAYIDGAEIHAIADLWEENTTEAYEKLLVDKRKEPIVYTGQNAWKTLCEQTDLDLIYICTDWDSHTLIATYAMSMGKHVAIEVPAATNVDECFQLVHTAEKTRRHCFMLENCCYDPFALTTIQMEREGILGDITYCEGAYIHDLRKLFEAEKAIGKHQTIWMEQRCATHWGNPYPTHGLGPIGLLLNIHRGDRLDYLVSLTANGTDSAQGIGKVNTTLIRTTKGRSIFIQHDVTTPRPYSRMQTVCGTRGFAQKYPVEYIQFDTDEEAVDSEEVSRRINQYTHRITATWGAECRRKKYFNEMNFIMDSRLIYCLRKGLPLDIDVYDAAEWSCIAELSEKSALNHSQPMEIPDFTHGNWQLLNEHTFA